MVVLAFDFRAFDLPVASSIKAPAAAAPTAIPVLAAGTIARPASNSASLALVRIPFGGLFVDELFFAGVFFLAAAELGFAAAVFFLAGAELAFAVAVFFFAGIVFLPEPPGFLPPPSCLFTVAQARFSASFF